MKTVKCIGPHEGKEVALPLMIDRKGKRSASCLRHRIEDAVRSSWYQWSKFSARFDGMSQEQCATMIRERGEDTLDTWIRDNAHDRGKAACLNANEEASIRDALKRNAPSQRKLEERHRKQQDRTAQQQKSQPQRGDAQPFPTNSKRKRTNASYADDMQGESSDPEYQGEKNTRHISGGQHDHALGRLDHEGRSFDASTHQPSTSTRKTKRLRHEQREVHDNDRRSLYSPSSDSSQSPEPFGAAPRSAHRISGRNTYGKDQDGHTHKRGSTIPHAPLADNISSTRQSVYQDSLQNSLPTPTSIPQRIADSDQQPIVANVSSATAANIDAADLLQLLKLIARVADSAGIDKMSQLLEALIALTTASGTSRTVAFVRKRLNGSSDVDEALVKGLTELARDAAELYQV